MNAALVDSLELAQQIEAYGLEHLDKAVAEYEKEMFPRAVEHIQESEQTAGFLFAADAPMGFLRSYGMHG